VSIQQPASLLTPTSSEIDESTRGIPVAMLAYFRGRLSNKVHELVLSEFAAQEREGKATRTDLARKVHKKPEQITRWLGSPGNWTLDTLSDLLLGMGLEPTISARSLASPEAHVYQIFSQFVQLHPNLNVQTAKEVAQDFTTGNEKSIYLSLGKSSTTSRTIDLQRSKSLPQSSLNVPLVIREKVYDHA
jgi:hypothetical protein